LGLGKLGGKWNQLFFGGAKKSGGGAISATQLFFGRRKKVAVRGKLSVLKGFLLILLILLPLLFFKQFIIERNFIINLFNSGTVKIII
jgi:hypothetical protein